ncbi:MAG: ribosome maturation factor RimM [Pseudoxanthomonas suwonensis]|nr:ribosome maturation factor RimM [Pseudoxanthomonas suwonensis]
MILVGRVVGAFGVRGEVKVESFTDPLHALLRYQPWTLRDERGGERTVAGVTGRQTPKGIVARFPEVDDRDQAEALRGLELWAPRSVLPPPAPGEYYWVDLEGLRVLTIDGIELGRVSYLFNTGANDVLVVQGERERMLPFIEPGVITAVDFDQGTITVDWDPEF